VLYLKSFLQGVESRKREITWDEVVFDKDATWSEVFVLDFWSSFVKDFGLKVYEIYDLNSVRDFKLEAPGIVKANSQIEEAYLGGVKVIQQDNYFYCDFIKFKAPYTGVLEVYYPSGRRGYKRGVYFGADFKKFYVSGSCDLLKTSFLNSLSGFWLESRGLGLVSRFLQVSFSCTVEFLPSVITNKFLEAVSSFTAGFRGKLELASEYWNYYDSWDNFGEYWGEG